MSSRSTVLAENVRAGPQSAVREVLSDKVQHHHKRPKLRSRAELGEELTSQALIDVNGVLEVHPKGYGFLRDASRDLQPTPGDVFVPSNLIDRLGLRAGVMVEGLAVQSRRAAGPKLQEVRQIEGREPEVYA